MTAHTGEGKLAFQLCGKRFPLVVLQTRAGFYIGTADEDGLPYSRESDEYWPSKAEAEQALASGAWTQKLDA